MEISRGKQEAKGLNCYRLTLNVWEGNDSAKAFYDKIPSLTVNKSNKARIPHK